VREQAKSSLFLQFDALFSRKIAAIQNDALVFVILNCSVKRSVGDRTNFVTCVCRFLFRLPKFDLNRNPVKLDL
jgi:hypothetical protein